MLELTTNPTREQVAAAWPSVAYKGDTNFFNNYIAIIDGISESVGCDNQECYLGYIPSTDRFIIGFDAWPAEEYDEDYDEYVDEEYNNVFSLTIRQNAAEQVSPVYAGERMFYSGCYKSIHSSYPDLLDIRLD